MNLELQTRCRTSVIHVPVFYLFGEVFGRPGLVVGRSLLLLPPLPLLQPVFVLRGLVDVPVLQGLGDVLPQSPTNRAYKI